MRHPAALLAVALTLAIGPAPGPPNYPQPTPLDQDCGGRPCPSGYSCCDMMCVARPCEVSPNTPKPGGGD